MKPAGAWVAVPMNIHRIDWLWGSGQAMKQAGIDGMPKTWAEFNDDCDKAVKAGLVCLAHFSEDWADATIFEVVLYGQDLDLYKKALVDGDTEAMRSPGIVKAFAQLRLMVSHDMDRGIAGRDFDTANSMLGTGKAAFMIMGDWEIGMLNAGGFKVGTDIACAQAPTDWNKPGFILNSDSVGFFTQSDPDYQAGQVLLAKLIMSPDFQTAFNQAKGSIPARLDVDVSKGFNPCQQKSQADLKASIEAGTLVRSFAHNMTVPQKVRGAMMEVITEFVNTDMAPDKAAAALADAAEAQQ
jgi:glucose/mannose transport system substrate-binding protein